MHNLIAIRLGLPRCLLSLIILLTLWSGFGHMARAQDKVAPEVMAFAREISKSCPHQWEEQACLSDVSASTLVLAANYAGDLQSNGMIGAVEQIKQHCAAATAATQGTYPAYAMKSAFTECANKIYDVSEQTSIKPDLSHYQLLIGAIWCMNKDSQCKTIEDQLGAFQ